MEMGAWNAEEAQAKAEALARDCRAGPVRLLRISARRRKRRASGMCASRALGAVVFVPGEPDRWEGWEDAAVPPEKLGAYLRSISALMAEYGYCSPLYGHYGQGCVHMRINFDFPQRRGTARISRVPGSRDGCGAGLWRIVERRTWRRTGARGACCRRCSGRS